MQIVVAGGTGFIGSHLCDRLLEQGHRLTCLDNGVTGRPANVAHLAGHPRFELIDCDVSASIPAGLAADRVYHLASPASPPRYLEIPIETLLVNSAGTQNLLELAERCGARFLLASTSEVYGNPLEHPQSERYHGNVSCTGPRSCYDEGKRYAEALTMAFHRARGLDVRIVRIFNTYGPRMNPKDGRALPNFVAQSISGQAITVYGSGDQTRSFCFVDDTVAGILALMERDGARGEPVNIGNPSEITLHELIAKIQELVGTSLPLVYSAMPQDDPVRRRPDIAKAQALLDWEPRVGLDEGLRATIAWFRDQIQTGEPSTRGDTARSATGRRDGGR